MTAEEEKISASFTLFLEVQTITFRIYSHFNHPESNM